MSHISLARAAGFTSTRFLHVSTHSSAAVAPPAPPASTPPAHAPPRSTPPPARAVRASVLAAARPRRRTTLACSTRSRSSSKQLHVAPRSAHSPHANLHCFPHHARQLLDELSEPFLRHLTLALAHPQPHSHHYSLRWATRRGRARRSWSRSWSTSGPVQRGRPRWWPRPLRSRLRGVFVRSGSGSSPAGAEAEAE